MLLVEDMHFPEDMRRWVVDEVTEKNILGYVFDAMDELHWELSDSEPDEICEDELDSFKDILGTWVTTIGACQCALLRALHIADCKRPPDKLQAAASEASLA